MRVLDTPQFQKWNELAATGQMVGEDRPFGRVTIAENKQKAANSNRPGPWRYAQFQNGREMEVPTVKSIEINRSIGDDAATCTIVFYNDATTADVPDDDRNLPGSPGGSELSVPDSLASWRNGSGYGRAGYLSPTRGTSHALAAGNTSIYNQFLGLSEEEGTLERYRARWEFAQNKWHGKFIPNRVIRTYQGYGSDNFDELGQPRDPSDPLYVQPWEDSKLVVTGTWLIDTVEMGTDGLLTVQCRDMGKLLLSQVVYPPMIPMSRFPLTYVPEKKPKGKKALVTKNRIRYHSDATLQHALYRRKGVHGHRGEHAFDGRPGSYWLSHSYAQPGGGASFEWIQGTCRGDKINSVTIETVGSGYVVYVSVKENGEWKGTQDIPYSPGASHNAYDHGHGAKIPYVAKTTMGKSRVTIKLPRAYKATLVRFTFTRLRDFNLSPLPYRVGVRKIEARFRRESTYKKGNQGKPGVISDWSQAIKELVGWAGFTWLTDVDVRGGAKPTALRPDPLLGRRRRDNMPLRIWGDIEDLGAGPIEPTPSDYFLNKTFMECVKMISDFLGCLFFIDEYGGVIFRFPNLWSAGNFMTDPRGPLGPVHTDHPSVYRKRVWPVELHEGANLINYSVTLDDSQVRSEVLVVGSNPDVNSDAMVAGGIVLRENAKGAESRTVDFTEVLAGQERLFLVPGEQTKGFKTREECQRMAELIGVKILQTYRKGTATIPGHPGIQLDDQVRIFERVTHENNVHYVSGISSHMDLETGEYLMDLTTHWIGGDPDRNWFLRFVRLTPAVLSLPAVIRRLGAAGVAQVGRNTKPKGADIPDLNESRAGVMRIASLNVREGLSDARAKQDILSLVKAGADVIALQEMGSRRTMLDGITGWGHNQPDGDGGATPVLWRKDKFTKISSGARKVSDRTYVGAEGAGPNVLKSRYIVWVKLREKKTGKIIIVGNQHAVPTVEVNGHPTTNPDHQDRIELYKEHMAGMKDWVRDRQGEGAVFLTGTFNVNYKADSQVKTSFFPYASMDAVNVWSNWRALGAPRQGTRDGDGEAGENLIDYVAYRRGSGLAPTRQWIIDRMNSDHHGVLVEFK